MVRSCCSILVMCLWVSTVLAGPHDQFLEKAKDIGWSGDASALLEHFQTPAFEKAAQDPGALHHLSMNLDSSIRILTVRGGDAVDEIFQEILPHAEALLEREPNTQRAAYIWASLSIAHERSLSLRGRKPDLQRWNRAVRLTLLVYEGTTQQVDTGLQVVRWVGQLAVLDDVNEVALLESADHIMQELLEANEGDQTVFACEGQLCLHKARAALTHGRKKDAKTIVAAGLAALERHIEQGDSQKMLGCAHTELVTFANDSKLRIKTRYRVEKGLSARGLVPYTIPRASSWGAGRAVETPQILTISQFGPEGRATRTIVLRAFKHGVPYDAMGTGEGIDGRNVKKMAEGLYGRAIWDLDPVTDRRRVKKGRAGKGWPTGYHYRIVGTDPVGRWVRSTVSFISSKSLGYTIELAVSEYEDEAQLDSEFQFVLTSLKIPK